jgi:hypothetical protein
VARHILMDELHVSVYAPRGLPAGEYDAVRLTLDGPRFRRRLKRAVRRVPRAFGSLNKVRVVVTR